MYDIDFTIIINWFPLIVEGLLYTIYISSLSMLLGTAIGIICGTIRSSPVNCLINNLIIAYVELFRGTPLLVQLFFIYFGLGQIGIKFTPLQASIITLSLNTGAYVCELIRSSIAAVDAGQYEAARALGMNHTMTMQYIILPQAVKIAVPPLVNCFSSVLKDSSLVSVLAIAELTRVGQQIYSATLRSFEAYTTLGALYLIMTLIISRLSRYAEAKNSVKV